ncbi:hypothetical protein GOV07_01350 [Candidatus Woesearchaeota archaeon]|nr:hypothetical protein [Candidatus Woesearchaeota archaeon]
MDEGLVRYIRERLGEGYAEEHVQKALLEHGHGQPEIDNAFTHIHHEKPPKILLSALLVILVIGAVAIFLALTPDTTPLPPQPPVEQQPEHVGPPSNDIIELAADLKSFTKEKTADETYYLTVETASTKAASTADAILICSINEDIIYKNYCLQEMAETRRKAAFCNVIGDTQQRDDCYLGLVFLGEDQYCSKLVLEQNQRVCDILGA